jgi:hypothetical protein
MGFFVQLASATQAQKTAIFGVVLLIGYLPLPMPHNRLKRRFSCQHEASANALANRLDAGLLLNSRPESRYLNSV